MPCTLNPTELSKEHLEPIRQWLWLKTHLLILQNTVYEHPTLGSIQFTYSLIWRSRKESAPGILKPGLRFEVFNEAQDFHGGAQGQVYLSLGVLRVQEDSLYFSKNKERVIKVAKEFSTIEHNLHRLPSPLKAKPITRLSDDPTQYLVMKKMPGITLDDFLNRFLENHDCDIHQRFEICLNLINALIEIEKLGIFHGDIKPKNILINPANRTVYVVDFGLSMRLSDPVPQEFRGTLKYAAPEVFEGRRSGNFPDIYSLAMVLAEVLGVRFKSLKRGLVAAVSTAMRYSQRMNFHNAIHLQGLPEHTTQEIEALLTLMSDVDDTQRPSLSQVQANFIELSQRLNKTSPTPREVSLEKAGLPPRSLSNWVEFTSPQPSPSESAILSLNSASGNKAYSQTRFFRSASPEPQKSRDTSLHRRQ